MSPEVMAEYLVQLSADVDTGSFNSAMTAINALSNKLKQMKGVAAAVALGGALTKIGTAAVGAIKDVARADMEFEKLGRRMWITKDNAKALSVAMKTMGCTEEDIAWVPELREQFFRLRNEMQELSTPQDAEDGLKFVRNIGYEIQSVQVKLKMLKEWVVYYLIKIIRPFMEEFREWVKWLSEKLKGRMPDIAKTIAKWLGNIVSLAASAMKVIRKIGESIYNFFEKMPESAKRWGAILAGVGAFVMASPLGKLLVVLGGALMLLEDFIYYCNGWNSSKALAPVWQTILDFLESDTLKNIKETALELLGKAGERLDKISECVAKIMSDLFDGIDWKGIFKDAEEGIKKLYDGIVGIGTELDKVFDSLERHTNERAAAKQKSFWGKVGEGISDALKSLFKFGGVLGDILSAASCLLSGDLEGAKKYAKSAVLGAGDASKTLLKNSTAGIFMGWGESIGDSVVNFLKGNYTEGDQWMVQNPENFAYGKPTIQCDSWTADAYAGVGVMPHKKGGITTAEDWGSAYHAAGDGYTPQKGDYIDGKTHVGIYLGDGMYMARNSSGGVHTGTMEEWNEWFGEPIGYGSLAEYMKNTQPEKYEAYMKQQQASERTFSDGVQKYGNESPFDDGHTQYGMWKKENPTDWMTKQPNWITTGAQNAASARSFGSAFAATSAPSQVSYGDINVNVNVAGTNASANDIANATAKKIVGARMNKGVLV